MSKIRSAGKMGKVCGQRRIKLAPVTRAVRSALAASALTLAIGLGGNAAAAGHVASTAHTLRIERSILDVAPVHDLTVVPLLAPGGMGGPVATLISQHYVGDVNIVNNAPIIENQAGDVYGISGYSDTGNVNILNAALGAISVHSDYGNAIGIYGYALAGNVAITNTGSIVADAPYGLADGIFASGNDVTVINTGAITATGDNWAAGIEAQAGDVTTVTNTGTISATASNGLAYGIYATGGNGVSVANDGSITARGYYATGIHAQSGGDVSITNYANGTIDAGSTSSSALAWGIYAASNGEGSQVTVDNAASIRAAAVYGATGISAVASGLGGTAQVNNSGDITALGYFGANGISAVASGLGGTASVDNSGNITVAQGNKYGYGANGIFVSADGDATITNTGAITVNSYGAATGLAALSFAGNASVVNAGDITVDSQAGLYFSAYGIVAFSGNGSASAVNSGTIDITSKYVGVGMDVGGLNGASASNSGDISVDAWFAYGIRAQSGNGDVIVDNSGSITATYSGIFTGNAFGILATSTNGNVTVDNSGSITTNVTGQSVGVFGVSSYGDVAVDNSGSIDAQSVYSAAAGIFARADQGVAAVTNSGTVTAYSGYGVAYGVIARGQQAMVDNSGGVQAQGYSYAIGIAALGQDAATIHSTAGYVDAVSYGGAIGMLASGVYGATIDSASDVTALSFYGAAQGVTALSPAGDASVTSSGTVQALSLLGQATGITAYSILGDAVIDNSGDVTAAVINGNGNAIGLYGYTVYGNASVHNTGAITAFSYGGLADGIFASGYVVDVANEGGIEASGYTWAAGIEAQGTAYARVTNSGDIQSNAMPFVQVSDYYGYTLGGTNGGQAFGIYVTGGAYGVRVDNSGALSVDGGYATGIEVQSGGNAVVINSGDINAGSGLSSYYNSYGGYTYYGTLLANGIDVTSNGANAIVLVQNAGDITADATFGANGISAVASGSGGQVTVYNDGNLSVHQANKYGYGAYGVFASGDGNAFVSNNNGTTVTVTSEGAATGLAALSFAGDATVINRGDIEVSNTAALMYGATGIVAFSANGDAAVGNYGAVNVTSKYQATGVDARALGDVTVVNGGSLYANGDKYAFGVYASAGSGDVMVSNQAGADIGFYSYFGRGFGVLGVSSLGDVMVSNAGSIEGYAYGQSAGVFAVALQGDASVSNSGSIDVTSGGNVAVGVFARADYGTATIVNSGSVHASDFQPGSYYTGYSAYGLFARGDLAQVGNSGTISVDGYVSGTGIVASSLYGTLVSNTGGSIAVTSMGDATGIDARSVYGNVQVSNASAISVAAQMYGGVGINGYSVNGNVTIGNSATLAAASVYSNAAGIVAGVGSLYGTVTVTNAGNLSASTNSNTSLAAGVYATSQDGSITVSNSSTGYINATGGVLAAGVYTQSYGGAVVVNNAGSIRASGGAFNVGVLFQGLYGSNTLNNASTGVIQAYGADGYAFAVVGDDSVETINNSGRILGAISLYGGNDVFNNAATGLWDVGSTTYTSFGDGNDTLSNSGQVKLTGGKIAFDAGNDTLTNTSSGQVLLNGGLISFGDGNDALSNSGQVKLTGGKIAFDAGNDTLTNAASGQVLLNGGWISFGDGDDTVNNAGLIQLSNNSQITMGITPLIPMATEVNVFNNTGTVQVIGSNSIDTYGGTFNNTGLVDFKNGVTTDQLTLSGTLAGTGAMNIDVNLINNTADQLIVNGDVASGAKQTVNVQFTGLPTTTTINIPFAQISGISAAGNFVPGQFIGYNANANFLTLGLGITSALNTPNDVFSISMSVTGLSDSGSLAASTASAMAGFMNAQMGTFRQRLGVNPYGDAGKVMSAFVRVYTDQGDVSQRHSSNFGSGGFFDFDTASWGREVGVNANLFGNFHAGLVLGNADSRQRLTGGGSGVARQHAMTVGGYLTWYVPGAWYADFAIRQMAPDIHMTSPAGTMASRAHVDSMSLEAGYEWSIGGITLVPQAQYTRTKVKDVDPFIGALDTLVVHGGTFERGRIGLEVNKTWQSASGVRWMPYASINAIHDFSGTSTYTVANVFTGSTTVKGSSAMAELGVGVQKGGLGFTLSANWNDGGPYKSFVGAQANLRYSW